MSETNPHPPRCPDCAARPAEVHDLGCDVARCPACGEQRIQCREHDADRRMDALAIWTGSWPGRTECDEWGWDLNQLARAAHHGKVIWSIEGQRYIQPT